MSAAAAAKVLIVIAGPLWIMSATRSSMALKPVNQNRSRTRYPASLCLIFEHARKDRIDMFRMVAKIELLLDLLCRKRLQDIGIGK